MTRIQYLGYIMDEDGVHGDLAKIQAIWDWLTPTTLTQLHNFLWHKNFYRRFMLGFSHIAWALSQVNKGGDKAKFVWSESQHKSFDEPKHCLCSAPVHSLPDLQQPFEIEIDALDYAVNTVLAQHGHPMAYHSDNLSDVAANIPPMIRRCILLYKSVENGSITFSERRQSSTWIRILYSS